MIAWCIPPGTATDGSSWATASSWHHASSRISWRRASMERLHMNYLRKVIYRLRARESDRQIARDLHLSRLTVPSTTTAVEPVGRRSGSRQAARQLLDGENGCVGPANAWHAATATSPAVTPENGSARAVRFRASGGLPAPLARPGRVQAPLFLRGLPAHGS